MFSTLQVSINLKNSFLITLPPKLFLQLLFFINSFLKF